MQRVLLDKQEKNIFKEEVQNWTMLLVFKARQIINHTKHIMDHHNKKLACKIIEYPQQLKDMFFFITTPKACILIKGKYNMWFK